MKPYTLFPYVYDSLLNHVDYERWYCYIRNLMFRYIDNPKWILELGCGTGRFGAKFSRDKFNIYGLDISFNMLHVAKVRARKNFRILRGDMTNFYLAKKFDFIFSVHDTMNYFLDPLEIKKVLKSVREIMHKGSIFMFDITTEFNIKQYFEDNAVDYTIKGIEINWANRYDEINKLVYSYLTFKKSSSTEIEEHIQRIYSINEIKELLELENFEVIDIFSDYSFSPVKNDSVMINFITRLIDEN